MKTHKVFSFVKLPISGGIDPTNPAPAKFLKIFQFIIPLIYHSYSSSRLIKPNTFGKENKLVFSKFLFEFISLVF